MSQNKMTQRQIAARLHLTDSEVSDLLTGRRKLTGSYLMRFIVGGVEVGNQINRGLIAESTESEFWQMLDGLVHNQEAIGLMKQIVSMGGDPVVALKNYLQILESVRK